MDELKLGQVSGMCGKAAYEYIEKVLNWLMLMK